MDLNDLIELRNAALKLDLGARHQAISVQVGGYRSPYRGRGLEFDEVREYRQGDNARDIDWRVTARRGKPHTKLFREERERPVWLLADLGPSSYFGSRRCLKSELLCETAALLAWSAVRAGDRVGAVLQGNVLQGDVRQADERVTPDVWRTGRPHADGKRLRDWQMLPPTAGERGVLPLLAGLIEIAPTAPAGLGEADLNVGLAAALKRLQAGLRRSGSGALIFLLSDLLGVDAADFGVAEKALFQIAQHNDLVLVQLTDPLDGGPLDGGPLDGRSPDGRSIRGERTGGERTGGESGVSPRRVRNVDARLGFSVFGSRRRVQADDQAALLAWRDAARRRQAAIKSLSARLNATHLRISTVTPAVDQLVEQLRLAGLRRPARSGYAQGAI